MFYYVLRNEFEQDVMRYAARHCRPGECAIEREIVPQAATGNHPVEDKFAGAADRRLICRANANWGNVAHESSRRNPVSTVCDG